MAKTKKSKIKKARKAKQSTQLVFDDSRWMPLAEITERLSRHIGHKNLIARDLTEALVSEKIRCMRRYAGEHTLSIQDFTDAELEVIANKKIEMDDQPASPELLPASFWGDHYLAYWVNGDIRVAFRLPTGPSFTLTANWVFYLWEPDCVKAWPALAPQEIDARKAKPRSARKRSTRKASQRVGTGSAIKAGDSAAASGSLYATEAGDTAAVAGRLKRKRRGKLTAEQIKGGLAYLRDHPELKPKQAYPGLRRVLNSDVGDTTLWRAFFRKEPI
ncbi:hypothetical protein Q3C01_41215 [Bradyrhizobium sp. UFLA05-109]